MQLKPRTVWLILVGLIIGYTVFFTTQLCLHYYTFGSRSLDLGNMNQSIWNSAQGRWFHQTNQPGANNRLSLHVEPILIPISWLYYLYSGPEILFFVQSLIVALGIIPIYGLARSRLDSDLLGITFGVVYLGLPAMQGATLLDFHAVTIAPTFLLSAFYFLERNQPRWFALFAVLAVACKEDMTLLVLMLGAYGFVINRQYRLGLTTIGLCLAWVYLAVFLIPPTFARTENIHWNRFDHLGDSPLNMVLNLFFEPHRAINHLIAVEAAQYMRLLLSPTAFLALFNPHTLLLALPSLGINLLSNFPPMQRVNSLIYAAPVVPAVIISAIYGAGNILRVLRGERLRQGAIYLLTCILLGFSLIYHLQYGYLPTGGQFRGWPWPTEHQQMVRARLADIPPEAKLSAQDRLNPHVAQRQTLYIFDRLEDADHIVLDVTEDAWPLHPVALRDQVRDFLRQGWGVVEATDGYLLLAKNQPDLPTDLPDPFFDFARADETERPAFETRIVFDDKLALLGYSLELGAHEDSLPFVKLYWEALQPLSDDYQLWPFFINPHGQMIEQPTERPLVAPLWYPTSQWQVGERIVVATLPWGLGDDFTLGVGVTHGSWEDVAQRLPISASDDGLYNLEADTWVRLNRFQQLNDDRWLPKLLALPNNAKRPRRYQPVRVVQTAPLKPMTARFLDIIQLNGVNVPDEVVAGQPLNFQLYWQANGPITVDLTSFVHLVDAQGHVVAQLDWTPQDELGYLPTSAWLVNRAIIDAQHIYLPSDLAPGEYQLLAGWYFPPTGERLPVSVDGGQPLSIDDRVVLGTVEVR